jgi:hypothetical protein
MSSASSWNQCRCLPYWKARSQTGDGGDPWAAQALLEQALSSRLLAVGQPADMANAVGLGLVEVGPVLVDDAQPARGVRTTLSGPARELAEATGSRVDVERGGFAPR